MLTCRILCIESSTDVCSVALFEGMSLLTHEESLEVNSHAEKLAPLIKKVLEKADLSFSQLDAVAVSNGPGSYTSLRVGLSTAKGICFATGKPLIALNSDHILIDGNLDNAREWHCQHVIAMIDARRMEAYCTLHTIESSKTGESQPVIFKKDSFNSLETETGYIGICGNGALKWQSFRDSDRYKVLSERTDARFMGRLATSRFKENRFDDLAYTIPHYIKPPNITNPKKNKWNS